MCRRDAADDRLRWRLGSAARQQPRLIFCPGHTRQRFPRQELLSRLCQRRRRRGSVSACRAGRKGLHRRGMGDQHRFRLDRRSASGQRRRRPDATHCPSPARFAWPAPSGTPTVNYAITHADLRDASHLASDDAAVPACACHSLADLPRQTDVSIPARSECAVSRTAPR